MKEMRESAEAERAEPTPIAPDALLTPNEWGIATRHIKPGALSFGGVQTDAKSAQFRSAAVIHGWDLHALHTAEPLKFSREDFDKAIAAAHDADDRGQYTPHGPACSPYSPFKK